jgi:hypothetical protein
MPPSNPNAFARPFSAVCHPRCSEVLVMAVLGWVFSHPHQEGLAVATFTRWILKHKLIVAVFG